MDPHLLRLFNDLGIILVDDHFVLQSGRHSDTYISKSQLSVFPEALNIVGFEMGKLASAMLDHSCRQLAVVAPAVGAISLGHVVSQHLLANLNLRNSREQATLYSLFAEKVEGPNKEKTFQLKRGYDRLVKGLPVVIVEDILTSGESAKLVVEAVRAAGGNVIGAVVLWNRGGVTPAALGDIPRLLSLVEQPVQSYPGDDCPLCRKGVPVNTQYGHGQAFLASRQSA